MAAHKVAGLTVAWIATGDATERRELRPAAAAGLVRSGEAGPLVTADDRRRAIARAVRALRSAAARRMLPGPKS